MTWRRGPPYEPSEVVTTAEAYAVHQLSCTTCSHGCKLCDEGMRLMKEFQDALHGVTNTQPKGDSLQ